MSMPRNERAPLWDAGPGPLPLGDLWRAAAVTGPAAIPPLASAVQTGLAITFEGLDATRITAVAQDHRAVRPGALFVARRGAKFDAHSLLPEAARAGAAALVGELGAHELAHAPTVPYLRVPDTRAALPHLAAAFERHPSSRMRVLGVTGTDGKTTTSYLLHWLLLAGREAALLSTAGIRLGHVELEPLSGHFTTPEATEVQALLGRFLRGGASHVVLESSSHGFSLHRLDAVEYAVGVFTNLTPEHLDHHGTLSDYRDAKATLVRRAATAAVNLDDEHSPYFLAAARAAGRRTVTFGSAAGADVRIGHLSSSPGRLEFELEVFGARATARLPMVGAFNAWNAAGAVAAAVVEGVAPEAAVARLATFPGVPGRMQVVQAEPATVIVDFAHTAPALAKALAAVRREGHRLIVVVGAAGERDPGKRAPIGREARLGADVAVFTEEDSRSESTAAILAEIGAGAAAAGGREGVDYVLEPDRRAAIRRGVELARPGDVVLLAGKGHERTLERSGETLAWDEASEARAALAGAGA